MEEQPAAALRHGGGRQDARGGAPHPPGPEVRGQVAPKYPAPLCGIDYSVFRSAVRMQLAPSHALQSQLPIEPTGTKTQP